MEYRYIIEIHGMMCGGCESFVNNQVRKNFSNVKVTSNRRKNETVIISKEKLNIEVVEKVMRDTHYGFVSIKEETFEKKSLFRKIFKK